VNPKYLKVFARVALLAIGLGLAALTALMAHAAVKVDAVVDCGSLVGRGLVQLNINGEAHYLPIRCDGKA
jgi:hypothetical protein